MMWNRVRVVKHVNISVVSTSIVGFLGIWTSVLVLAVALVFTSVAKMMEFGSCIVSACDTSPEPHLFVDVHVFCARVKAGDGHVRIRHTWTWKRKYWDDVIFRICFERRTQPLYTADLLVTFV